jgi:hypothetical protein
MQGRAFLSLQIIIQAIAQCREAHYQSSLTPISLDPCPMRRTAANREFPHGRPINRGILHSRRQL